MDALMMTEQLSPLSELNDELREFAAILRMVRYQPTFEEAITAVNPHFPELTSQAQTVEQVLEPVGLVVIVDMGQGIDPKRISWSIGFVWFLMVSWGTAIMSWSRAWVTSLQQGNPNIGFLIC